MVRYINAKFPYIGAVTLDSIDSLKFQTKIEFHEEIKRVFRDNLKNGNPVYISQRKCGAKKHRT